MSRLGPVVCCWVALAVPAAGGGRTEAAEPAKEDANQCYQKFVRAYLHGDWTALKALGPGVARHGPRLTPAQRSDVAYIRKTAPTYRPSWWKACKQKREMTIRAKVWGRPVAIHFVPAEKPDIHSSLNAFGRIEVTASWDPALVGSTDGVGREPATSHGMTMGDQAEVCIWQFLGFSYKNLTLPAKTVDTLHREHRETISHVNMFYAAVTGLYYSSPHARRMALLMVLDGLGASRGKLPRIRSCRAMAAVLVATVLADPSKWPSLPLPEELPAFDEERITARHMLENLDPNWTLAENRALREAVRNLMTVNRDRILRGRGRVQLPNKTVFMLMKPQDAAAQAQRNAWVRKQLEKARK